MSCLDIVAFIVNIISAVGTFGAAAIALWLALQGQQPRIDCVFMWEEATKCKPTLIINNIGNRTVVVERVDIFFHKQKVGSYDILRDSVYSDNAIIASTKGVRIVLESDAINIDKKEMYFKNPKKPYDLIVVVTTSNKKRYKMKQRYCYDDIDKLFFLEGFMTENIE